MNKSLSCRLCMCLSDALLNIFERNYRSGIIVAELIVDLIRMEVSEYDFYPPVVCGLCLDKLVQFKEFKDSCLNTKARFDALYIPRQVAIHPNREKEEMCLPQDEKSSSGNGDGFIADEDTTTSTSRSAQYGMKDEIDFTVNEVFIKIEPGDDYEIEEAESITNWQSEQNSDCSSTHSIEEINKPKSNVNTTQNIRNLIIPDVKRKDDKSTDSISWELPETCSSSTTYKSKKDGEAWNSPGERLCSSELRRRDIMKKEHSLKKNKKEEKITSKHKSIAVIEASKIPFEDAMNDENENMIDGRHRDVSYDSEHKSNTDNTNKEEYIKGEGTAVVYKCDRCCKEFKDKYSLSVHISFHELRVSNDVKTQERIHIKQKTFKCRFCMKCFFQRGNLRTHERIHTKEKPFKCSYCEKYFCAQSGLAAHEKTHTKEKPFRCNLCEKCFSRKSHLRTHERIHTNEKPFGCIVCEKYFCAQSGLIAHMRTHTDEKPFRCTCCDKCFSRKSHLRTHERIHTNEKPFKCSYCEKSFSVRCNLTAHERTHTKEKPFKCSLCEKCFSHQGNLIKHEAFHKRERQQM